MCIMIRRTSPLLALQAPGCLRSWSICMILVQDKMNRWQLSQQQVLVVLCLIHTRPLHQLSACSGQKRSGRMWPPDHLPSPYSVADGGRNFGSWQRTCMFRAKSPKTKCTKSVSMSDGSAETRERCLCMVKHWLLQAPTFDRARTHGQWNPRSHETPPASVLDAQSDVMTAPAADVVPDDVLDRRLAQAKAKAAAKAKGKAKSKPKAKAKRAAPAAASAAAPSSDEFASDPTSSSSSEPSSSDSSSSSSSSSSS